MCSWHIVRYMVPLYVLFPQCFHVPSFFPQGGSDLLKRHKSLPPHKVRLKQAKEKGEDHRK